MTTVPATGVVQLGAAGSLDASEEEAPEDDLPLSCAADVAAIRQSLELLVYGFLPLGTAFFLVYKFCMLFYSTFIRDVL